MAYTREFPLRGATAPGRKHLLAKMNGSPQEGLQPAKTMGFDVEMLLTKLPTVFKSIEEVANPAREPLTVINPLVPRAFDLRKMPASPFWMPLFRGQGTAINALALSDDKACGRSIRDADADHLWFVYEGKGRCFTDFGEFTYEPGDFVYLPRGALACFFAEKSTRMIGIESAVGFGKRARSKYDNLAVPFNDFGLKLPMPFGRDIGTRFVYVRRGGRWNRFEYVYSPYLCAAWMGTIYPFAIHASKLNLPHIDSSHPDPSNFAVFAAHDGSAMVSVLGPRRMHSLPYHHMNPLTEVLFYAKAYDARKGSKGPVGQPGTATVHPMGVWHGPQMGAVEDWKRPASAKELPWVEELAIMFETTSMLTPCAEVLEILVPDYEHSWLESWEEYQSRKK